MKKLIIALIVALLLLTVALPISLFADTEQGITSISATEEEAEEFQMFYRVNDGVVEKRLWSITYGYWVWPAWVKA